MSRLTLPRQNPEVCPIQSCGRAFKNRDILRDHMSKRHSTTFLGTVIDTPVGLGFQLIPVDKQQSSNNANTNTGGLSNVSRRNQVTQDLASTMNGVASSPSSSILVLPTTNTSSVNTPTDVPMYLNSDSVASDTSLDTAQHREVQRSRTLDPNATAFQPLQYRLPSFLQENDGISVNSGRNEQWDNSYLGASSDNDSHTNILAASELSESTEDLYNMVDFRSEFEAVESPPVSPINSIFDSPLMRHSISSNHSSLGSTASPTFEIQEGSSASSRLPSNASTTIQDLRNTVILHTKLNGRICDIRGNFSSVESHPSRLNESLPQAPDWNPFQGRVQFEFARLSHNEVDLSPKYTDKLMKIWALTKDRNNLAVPSPFQSHMHMLEVIDSIPVMDEAPWLTSTFGFNATPESVAVERKAWMDKKVEVWGRDPCEILHMLLRNSSFADKFDTTPYRKYNGSSEREYSNFFSGDWTWQEADAIVRSKIEGVNGAMLVPVLLSNYSPGFCLGQIEYRPIFISIGNFHNNARHSYSGGVMLLGFLASPKMDGNDHDGSFRKFQDKLLHLSLSCILENLKPLMTKTDIVKCPDGHFRRAIYSIGPHLVADIREHNRLTCVINGWCSCCIHSPQSPEFRNTKVTDNFRIRDRETTDLLISSQRSTVAETHGILPDVVPYTNDLPRADVNKTFLPSITDHVLKSAFLDHNMEWLKKYFIANSGEVEGKKMMDEVIRRAALAPPFTGYRRLPRHHEFQYWTAEEGKVLMKIILPCLAGIVSNKVLLTFRHLIDFCFLIHRTVIPTGTIAKIKHSLEEYRFNRVLFKSLGICKDFSLPQQHMLFHFPRFVQLFGAPASLYISIMDSQGVKTAKKHWKHPESRNSVKEILGDIERADKLTALRQIFKKRGYFDATASSETPGDGLNDFDSESGSNGLEGDLEPANKDAGSEVIFMLPAQDHYPRRLINLAGYIMMPELPSLFRQFLFDQLRQRARNEDPSRTIPPSFFTIPYINANLNIDVYHSAKASFYAPSDPCGRNGMRSEILWSSPNWKFTASPRRDCILFSTDKEQPDISIRNCEIARVYLFFSTVFHNCEYNCAVVQLYKKLKDSPDDVTGMWEVSPCYQSDGQPSMHIIQIEDIVRAAHLMPRFGKKNVRRSVRFTDSLDRFDTFYINCYVDFSFHESFSTC